MEELRVYNGNNIQNSKVGVLIDVNTKIIEGEPKNPQKVTEYISVLDDLVKSGNQVCIFPLAGSATEDEDGNKVFSDLTKDPGFYSTEDHIKYIKNNSGLDISFVKDYSPESIAKQFQDDVGIFAVENVKGLASDKAFKSNESLIKEYAGNLDAFVNCAMPSLHRSTPFTYDIPMNMGGSHLPLNMVKAILMLKEIGENPNTVYVVGGTKKEKVFAVEDFSSRGAKSLIGGAVYNTFLKSQGYDVGSSKICEGDFSFNPEYLICGDEVVVADKDFNNRKTTTIDKVEDMSIYDVVLKEKHIQEIIDAEDVAILGTTGLTDFEFDGSAKDTIYAIVERMKLGKVTSICGGDTVGDFIAVAKKYGIELPGVNPITESVEGNYLRFYSAGGASLGVLRDRFDNPGIIPALLKK